MARKNTWSHKDGWCASRLREFRIRFVLYTSLLLESPTNTVYDSLTMKNGSNLHTVFKVSQKQLRILGEARYTCTSRYVISDSGCNENYFVLKFSVINVEIDISLELTSTTIIIRQVFDSRSVVFLNKFRNFHKYLLELLEEHFS